MNKKHFEQLCIAIVFAVFASFPVNAQTCPQLAGCPDPTFGNDGKVVAQIDSTDPAWAQGVAAQSDGKMVVFVETADVGGYKLFRLNADGSFDETFGTGGTVSINWTLTLSNGTKYPSMLNSIAIQTVEGEERIVVAGWDHVPSGRSAVMALRLNRYMPDGTLDPSFGTGGKVSLAGDATDVAIQSDQKIVTVGSISGLVRFDFNGGLDTTFGTGGKANIGQGYTRGIAFDSNGNILLSGRESFGKGKNATQQMSVRRYRPTGTLDTTFGTNGTASASFGYTSSGTDVMVDVQDNIVVSGFARAVNIAGSANFAVTRFTSTGQPDLSFAGIGKTVFDFAGHDDFPTNVLLQASGKIIVAGYVLPQAAAAKDFGAIRINHDGSIDPSFGNAGRVVADVFGDDNSRGSVLQIDPLCLCEKLVMSGGDTSTTTFARFTTQPY